jgi:RimJ/RimL family protein N-acetyltransferase
LKLLEVGAEHFGLYGLHLKNLEPADRYTRFGYHIKHESVDQLILNMLYNQRDHFLFVAKLDGDIAGFGHLAREGDAWELAVSVEQQFQSRGIGSQLISFMVKWGQTRGMHSVFMHCISDNQKIQHLARKHGLKTIQRDGHEITALLQVPPPTVTDYMINHVIEQNRIMTEMVSLQRELLTNFAGIARNDLAN